MIIDPCTLFKLRIIIISDMPILVSGKRIGFFDPQQKIWPRQTGQEFELSELQNSSIITALDGLANFHADSSSKYPHTIFRFPLRKEISELSKNIYNVAKVKKLLEALREEAKHLLLFLNSVTRIEVIYIHPDTKKQVPSFSVSVDRKYLGEIGNQRSRLLAQLPTSDEWHVLDYSSPIHFVVDFEVTVKNCLGQSNTSHWVVATYAGSRNQSVLEIVKKNEFKFPRVGAAFELSQHQVESGRIFCFLPLPVELSSNLPIHVNGTFSLNDDRRSLKWPSAERTNDVTSQWNSLIVKELLPECYFELLLKLKAYGYEQFVAAWPDPAVMDSHWLDLLHKFYNKVLETDFLWCARLNCWISHREATFVPQDEEIAAVVIRAVTKCQRCVIEAPEIVWKALMHCKESEKLQLLTPRVARMEIRQNRASYERESPTEKLKLLEFCLIDERYSELQNIALVPLANSQFKVFDASSSTPLYVCSEQYPKSLFHNLDSRLVDAPETLQLQLLKVAASRKTQLKILDANRVAVLLGKCFPTSEQYLPSSAFPTDWCKTFWTWVQDHNLSHFVGLPILPLATQSPENGFNVIKLAETARSSTVFAQNKYECGRCPNELESALDKLGVKLGIYEYTQYVMHDQIDDFVHNIRSPAGVLTAISNANPNTSDISLVNLSNREAMHLQHLLCQATTGTLVQLSSHQQSVLEHVPMFKLINSDEMISIVTANSKSWNSVASLEPDGFPINNTSIPDGLTIFSRKENQLELFEFLRLAKPRTTTDLLQTSVFPMISSAYLDSSKIDMLMQEIIKLLPVVWNQRREALKRSLASLPFLPTVLGERKSPDVLFDPTNEKLQDLYLGQDVFPRSPFDEPELVIHLRWCGLQTSVSAQKLLNLFASLTEKNSKYPTKVSEQNFSRIETMFDYISSNPSLLGQMVIFQRCQLQLHNAFMKIVQLLTSAENTSRRLSPSSWLEGCIVYVPPCFCSRKCSMLHTK